MASTGKRFAVGCGAILLLMIFSGWAGCVWMKSHYGFTLSDDDIRARAAEMIPIAIPEDYEPMFSLYTNDDELQRDPLAMFRYEKARGEESLLLIHEQQQAFSSAEAFNRINNARNGLRPASLTDASREEWPVEFQGQQLTVVMEQGLDENEALRRRLSVVLAWDDHHVLLFADGPPNALPRDLLSTLLETL